MSDTFRKVYKPLCEGHSALILAIKEKAEELEVLIKTITHSREMSLAMTKLEECTMWATKAIVLRDESEPSEPSQPSVADCATCATDTQAA